MSGPNRGGARRASGGAEFCEGAGGEGVGSSEGERVRDTVEGARVWEGTGGEVRERGIGCGGVHEHC